MLEFRELIRSLTEGRTVVLSSHLLDEVEKTCDAIAIVDRGRVLAQGPINELTAGPVLCIECSDPARAAVLLRMRADVETVREDDGGLFVQLASAEPRAVTSYVAYVLMDAGF
jgi:ABC-2 type transport system ATP-binding protein